MQAGQKIEVIKDLDLEINRGEFVALVGPSGSGKTTLLQIAGLLDEVNSGEIIINGIDASKASDQLRTEIRKKNIGFIYQFHHLLPEFSALENTMMPLLIQGNSKKNAKEIALKILHEVGLEDRVNHRPAELSGGQQQRVAIARAIVAKPSLILADEPTGNLDSEIASKVFELMKNLTKTYDISCLMVTHNNELAAKTDKIINLRQGKVY